MSFADGAIGSAAAGRLFFYLTAMDETGKHIKVTPGIQWLLRSRYSGCKIPLQCSASQRQTAIRHPTQSQSPQLSGLIRWTWPLMNLFCAAALPTQPAFQITLPLYCSHELSNGRLECAWPRLAHTANQGFPQHGKCVLVQQLLSAFKAAMPKCNRCGYTCMLLQGGLCHVLLPTL